MFLFLLSVLYCATWLSPVTAGLESQLSDSVPPTNMLQERDALIVDHGEEEGYESGIQSDPLGELQSQILSGEDEEDDAVMSRDTRDPRLRFLKREDDEDLAETPRDIRAPRLRFIKREPRLRFIKREPRLRFIKREPEPRLRFIKREPRLRFIKREPRLRFIKREPRLRFIKREPRLRFIKREPRLRFIKREPRLRFTKREAIPREHTPSSANESLLSKINDDKNEYEEKSAQSASTRSRKRRSAKMPGKLSINPDSVSDNRLPARQRRQWSFNNDMKAIRDMVLYEQYRNRQEELRNLREALRRAGKRSEPTTNTDTSDVNGNLDLSLIPASGNRLPARQRRQWSFNNDMNAIRDMVLYEQYRRRQEELRNLRKALRRVGKRTEPPIGEDNADSDSYRGGWTSNPVCN